MSNPVCDEEILMYMQSLWGGEDSKDSHLLVKKFCLFPTPYFVTEID